MGKKKVFRKSLEEGECEGRELRAMVGAATDYALHARDFHANPTPLFKMVAEMIVGAYKPFYIQPLAQATHESLLRVIAEVFVERRLVSELPHRLRPKRNPKEIH